MRNAVLFLLVWAAVGMCQFTIDDPPGHPGAITFTTTTGDDHRVKGKNEYLLIVSYNQGCNPAYFPSTFCGDGITITNNLWFPTAQEAVDWVNEFVVGLKPNMPDKKYTFQSLLKVSDIPLKQVDQKVIETQTKAVEVEVEVIKKKYVLP